MPSTILLSGCGLSSPSVAAPPSGWNAGDYGTVLADWDFSDSSKVLNNTGNPAGDGESIQDVTDNASSPNNLQQLTSGNRPTCQTAEQNGLQIARFDTDDFFPLSTGAKDLFHNRAGLTFAFVAKLSALAAYQTFIYLEDSASAVRLYLAMTSGADGELVFAGKAQDAGTAWDGYSGANKLSASAWHRVIISVNYSGNAAKVYVDNAAFITKASISSTGNSSAATTWRDSMLLGRDYGARGINGDVGQVLIFDGAFDDSAVSDLDAALVGRWGL